jgi:hypothetical protein
MKLVLKINEKTYLLQDIFLFALSKPFKVLISIIGFILFMFIASNIKDLFSESSSVKDSIQSAQSSLRQYEGKVSNLASTPDIQRMDRDFFPIFLKNIEYLYGFETNSIKIDERNDNIEDVSLHVYVVEATYDVYDYRNLLNFINDMQQGWFNIVEVKRLGDGKYTVRYEVYTK